MAWKCDLDLLMAFFSALTWPGTLKIHTGDMIVGVQAKMVSLFVRWLNPAIIYKSLPHFLIVCSKLSESRAADDMLNDIVRSLGTISLHVGLVDAQSICGGAVVAVKVTRVTITDELWRNGLAG